jgi:hypothetical protein
MVSANYSLSQLAKSARRTAARSSIHGSLQNRRFDMDQRPHDLKSSGFFARFENVGRAGKLAAFSICF